MTTSFSRRKLLRSAGAVLATGGGSARAAPPLLDLRRVLEQPLIIEALDVLQSKGRHFIRARTRSGAVGYAVPNQHGSYIGPLFKERVAPYFIGKDARDLEALIDGVHVHNSNYKIVGLPFWMAVSWGEFALLDLMGRLAGKPVGELLGGRPVRHEVPMYLSSTDRSTTPEEEVARFEKALATTGAQAVKFKVGGRMSGNADASPRRTETLIALMRKRLGEKVTLYADANGSFDAAKGIEVGRMLEANGVAMFEEPCPFEDYEATRRVTKALRRIKVAGGEQDTSWYRFRDLVDKRMLDILQPDLSYNGGFLRTMRVARMAAAAGLAVSPHCPQASTMLYTLHLASFTPNMTAFQEIHINQVGQTPWFAPGLRLERGVLPVPRDPGLGLTIDPTLLAAATVL